MKAMFRSIWRGLKAHFLALLTLIALICIGVLLLTGGVYVASQDSRFCATCHYMKPYYDHSLASSHADVACVACHPVRPVVNAVSALRYFTGTQTLRPRAEVDGASCMTSGCHDERLLMGDAEMATEKIFEDKIHFDHGTHMAELRRGKRLQCTSCHSQIMRGEHVATTEETCFLCHFKGVGEAQAIGGCTNCHGTPTEVVRHEGFVFSHESYLKVGVACQQCHVEVIDGNGQVPRERCFSCHVEHREEYENSEFIHAKHVTEHDVDCFECHEKIQHGNVRMIRALEPGCENCHQSLHQPQREMYIGSGGQGLEDIPSRMFAAQVSCDGCHTRSVHLGAPEFDETSREAERQSCVECHGPSYDLMLDDWMREMDRLERSFEPELERAEAKLIRLEKADADVTEARLLVEKARHNFDFLKYGHGVHNVEYAVRLTRASATYLDQAMDKMDAAYRPPERSRLLASPDGSCSILCHARLGLPEEMPFDHLDFPHALHVEEVEVECTQCHSPDKHKMQIITRSECMDCHHEAQDIDCAHCHPHQDALYTGQVEEWGFADGYPDFMAEGDVTCDECHDLSAGLSIQDMQTGCVDCHEEGYDEMLGEWINDLQKNAGEISVQVESTRLDIEAARRRRQDTDEAEELHAQATRLVQLVDLGKGSHNSELAQELLEAAREKLQETKNLLEEK